MSVVNGFFPINQEEVDKQAGNSPVVFLKEGVTQIRILPPYSEKGIWCKEAREHSVTIDGKFSTVYCPKYHADSECPFCEEGHRLYEMGDEASVTASKEFKPKKAFLFNVIIFSAPGGALDAKKGVKVLKTGITVKRNVFDLDQDAAGGWGNITDLEKGFDIRITATGQNRNREYIIKGIPQRTNVLDVLKAQGVDVSKITPVNLDSLVTVKTYAALKNLLESARPRNSTVETQVVNVSGEAQPGKEETF